MSFGSLFGLLALLGPFKDVLCCLAFGFWFFTRPAAVRCYHDWPKFLGPAVDLSGGR